MVSARKGIYVMVLVRIAGHSNQRRGALPLTLCQDLPSTHSGLKAGSTYARENGTPRSKYISPAIGVDAANGSSTLSFPL